MSALSAIKNVRWQPNSLLVIFFAGFFSLFLILGSWQLNRAEEKRQWLFDRESAQQNPFQKIYNPVSDPVKEFDKVELTGQFDYQQAWLLENQTVNGQIGFDLIAPFVTEQGSAVLVNLGWQANKDLSAWLNNTGQTNRVRGMVRMPSDLPFVSNVFSAQVNAVVELVPGQFPYANLTPSWFMQIDPSHKLALLTHWQGQTISPAKHTGYAVQWFTMAAVLTVAFLFANTNIGTVWRERKHTSKKNLGH